MPGWQLTFACWLTTLFESKEPFYAIDGDGLDG